MRTIEVIRRGRKGDDGLSNLIGVETRTADYTATNADSGKAFRCTAALTLTLPVVLADGWSLIVDADGGDVTISTAATINGAASLVVTDGNSALVYSSGSAHFARFFVASAIASIAASGVGFTPVTGNPATDVQSAIANIQTDWNLISAYALTLLDDADAATARTTLGLGSAAVANLLDEDDFASDSATDAPSQQSVGYYVGAQKQLQYAAAVDAITGAEIELSAAIPAGVKEIEVIVNAIQFDAGDNLLCQIGGASGYKVSGYDCHSMISGGAGATSTTGLVAYIASSANTMKTGTFRLRRFENHVWHYDFQGLLAQSTTRFQVLGTGFVDLTEEVTSLRIGRSASGNFTGSGRAVVNWR